MAVERFGRLVSRPTVARQPTQPPAWRFASNAAAVAGCAPPHGGAHQPRDWSPCRATSAPTVGVAAVGSSRRPAMARASIARPDARGSALPVVSERAAAQLSTQVHTLCSKLDRLLAAAGRVSASARNHHVAVGASGAERIVELVERMAHLEVLVDEVAASGILQPSMRKPEAEAAEADPNLRAVAKSLLDVMRQRQAATPSAPSHVPFLVVRQPSGSVVQTVRGGTPLASARMQNNGGVEMQGAGSGCLTATTGLHLPGGTASAGGARGSSPQRASWHGDLLGFHGRAASLGQTPRMHQAPGAAPVLSQTLPLAAGQRLIGAGAGGAAGAEGWFSPPKRPVSPARGTAAAAAVPARAFSAPRPVSSRRATSPVPVLTASVVPPSLVPPPGIHAMHPNAGTPGPPPLGGLLAHPLGLWSPSPGQLLQGDLFKAESNMGSPAPPMTTPPPRGPAWSTDAEGAEAKIREWLTTIPIGNGASRGWDDAQILEIAKFAQEKSIGDLPAEDIYKRYVEHQVEESLATAGM